MDAYHPMPEVCALPKSPLNEALQAYGMFILGAYQPDIDDKHAPLCRDGQQAKTILLVGNAGPSMWMRFRAERLREEHPMDAWTRRSLSPIAEEHGFDIVFPFDGPPFLPFTHWGTQAGAYFIGPGVPNVHPIYGSWFGLRAALLSTEDCRDLAPPPFTESPCDECTDRLCLQACPSEALELGGYDIARCIDYTKASPGYPCIKNGCRARHACHLGQEYAYGQEQAEFHMRGFIDLLDKIKPKT